jgi:hypothetical protein
LPVREAKSEGINIKEMLDGDMIGYAETYDDQHTIGIYGSGTLAAYSQEINDNYPGLIDLNIITYAAQGNSDHWPFIEEGKPAKDNAQLISSGGLSWFHSIRAFTGRSNQSRGKGEFRQRRSSICGFLKKHPDL